MLSGALMGTCFRFARVTSSQNDLTCETCENVFFQVDTASQALKSTTRAAMQGAVTEKDGTGSNAIASALQSQPLKDIEIETTIATPVVLARESRDYKKIMALSLS